MMEQVKREQGVEEVILKSDQEKRDLEAGKMRVIPKDFCDFAHNVDVCVLEVHRKLTLIHTALIAHNDGHASCEEEDLLGGCEMVISEVLDRLAGVRVETGV